MITSRRIRVVKLYLAVTLTLSLLAATSTGPATAQAAPPALPASLSFADSAFESVWLRTDQPVASGAVARSWVWGPAPGAVGLEPYAEAADGSGMRLVQYFDKSRMEINDPKANPSAKWFVTNGLLAVELISGRIQVGNTKFETRKPADIPLASDTNDATAPTYASFGAVSNTSAGEKRQPDRTGQAATGRISRQGAVTTDDSKATLPEAKITYFEKATGHNVPKVFMDFLTSAGTVRNGRTTARGPLLGPWVFVMGLPISDAYWSTVKIDGKSQEVLIQAFERRVLTYAPALAQGWQVQMGNIGQHYFQWRYGAGGALAKLPEMPPDLPARFSIPVLGVSTVAEHVGVDKDNNMGIPTDPANVAWFDRGTVPGNRGNAAIDGHLDWYGVKQAVFYFLGTLKAGDRVYVRDARGKDRAFVVRRLLTCTYQNCPLKEIFGPTSVFGLNLITCQGQFNRAQQQYDKRLVVFTELAR